MKNKSNNRDPFFDKDKVGTAGKVIAFAAEQYKISTKDIVSSSISQLHSRARFVSYYILYKVYGFSMVEIGKIFDRNHSTIGHGIWRIESTKIGPDIIKAYKTYEK
jgi:chromosomal replication initiation ATPase DnaA